MVEKESSSIPYKTFLYGGALIGLIALSALLLWPSPCDSIFEQTAPKVNVNMKIIESEGAFVVSREKIQRLSESAQKVGLHLKTCCSVLDGGKLNPKQFQQCIDKASGYEEQIALVAQHVTESSKAKENGDTVAVQAKIAQINRTIETATSNAKTLAQLVEKELKPLPSQGKTGDAIKEQESNNQIIEANIVQLGTRVRGEIKPDLDRDYFKFRTSDQASSKTRVILRKLSTGGFRAYVSVYDQVEARVAKDFESSDDPVTLSFTSTSNSEYYVMIKSSGAGGSYELEVREE